MSSPRFSIVLVTYNHLDFTRMCLASVLANTSTPEEFEVIAVDNASSDGTVEYLERAATQNERVRLILNASNRGFAPAVNQGLDAARGDVLIILNNDTLVAPGWHQGLADHLAEPEVGLVGPLTNHAPNDAQIETAYRTYGGFERFAASRIRKFAGRHFSIDMLTMFCLAMRRDTYARLGALDERFAIGTFEDDDYSCRARQAGYRIVCAEDVFVHHFGQASFGDLVPGGTYAGVFAANRRRFEDKWGGTWEPHRQTPGPTYQLLVERVRSVVRALVPAHANVLVTSKGDNALLDLGADRRGWHFPQLADGTYAGYFPADSAEAIAQLERLRAAGADHLVLPSMSLWWLEQYPGFRQHLEAKYERRGGAPETCVVYDLRERSG